MKVQDLLEDQYDAMDKKLPGVNAAAKMYASFLEKNGIKVKFTPADYDTDAEIDIKTPGKDGYEVHVTVGMNKKWTVVKVKDGKFMFGKASSGLTDLLDAVKKVVEVS